MFKRLKAKKVKDAAMKKAVPSIAKQYKLLTDTSPSSVTAGNIKRKVHR